MQRRPRKVTSRQRNPRAARNPAYQIRPRIHLAPESDTSGRTEPWNLEKQAEPDDRQWRKPDDPSEAVTPEETSYHPEVAASSPRPESSDDAAPVSRSPETHAPPVTVPADATPAPPPPEPTEDFATYVRKIEEAAARSRAERRGPALAGHHPIASSGRHPATAVTPQYSRVTRGGRPPGAGPGGRGGNRGGRRPPPPVAQKPFFRRRRTWLMILALLVLIPVVFGLLYAGNVLRLGINAYHDIHTTPEDRVRYRVNPMGTPEAIPTEEAEAALPDWGANDVVNIVLMGIDVRSDEDESIRSDTIIVVHVDPQDGQMAMMSIPRDLLVYIPEFGHDKMNAAYAIGDARKDTIPGGGPTLVAQTIEANFNIPIHYYATVDFLGFQKIVDTVGGVIVDVPSQLSDNLYPTEDLRLTRIYFGSGLQRMDGEAALQYVRTRHADSDLARGQRQQQVLMAIRERAVVRDLITRAPELIEDVGDTLRTDLDFNQLLALANLGRQMDPDKIARVDLWQEGILVEHFPEFEGDAYYLDADWERIHELQAEFFGVPEPEEALTPDALTGLATPAATSVPPATPTEVPEEPDLDTPVMVENGTDVPVLAGHTAQFLFDSGFTAVWASDADEPASTTVIYDSSSNGLTAQYLADLLGLSRGVIVEGDGNDDIIVVIGDDFPRDLTPEPDP